MKHEEISLNTKRALSDALKEAMKTKPFQKITVSELIRTCNINRKTFYYHFADIYDLLKWTIEQEAIEVVKHFNLLVDYEEAITFIMDYVEANDYMLNCAYDSIGRDELKRFFYVDFLELANSMIAEIETLTGTQLEPSYKEFLTLFYVEALTGILIDWIKNRQQRDRNTVIQFISDTIRQSLIGIFQNYGQTE